MEYEIKDVVKVTGVRSGFYGVVAGRNVLPDGLVEYDVAPLNGKSSWRISADKVSPTDRGFPAEVIDKVLSSFTRDQSLPFRPSLTSALVKQLCREGISLCEGYTVAFEPAKLAREGVRVNYDRLLGLYWVGKDRPR